jgi:hypothetical protein
MVMLIKAGAGFGAQYPLTYPLLLVMQAEQRQMTPMFLLPSGTTDGTSGRKEHGCRIWAGEKAHRGRPRPAAGLLRHEPCRR